MRGYRTEALVPPAAVTLFVPPRSEIKLAKVDATEDQNKALAERIGVKGFPTIKIFRYEQIPRF